MIAQVGVLTDIILSPSLATDADAPFRIVLVALRLAVSSSPSPAITFMLSSLPWPPIVMLLLTMVSLRRQQQHQEEVGRI